MDLDTLFRVIGALFIIFSICGFCYLQIDEQKENANG